MEHRCYVRRAPYAWPYGRVGTRNLQRRHFSKPGVLSWRCDTTLIFQHFSKGKGCGRTVRTAQATGTRLCMRRGPSRARLSSAIVPLGQPFTFSTFSSLALRFALGCDSDLSACLKRQSHGVRGTEGACGEVACAFLLGVRTAQRPPDELPIRHKTSPQKKTRPAHSFAVLSHIIFLLVF